MTLAPRIKIAVLILYTLALSLALAAYTAKRNAAIKRAAAELAQVRTETASINRTLTELDRERQRLVAASQAMPFVEFLYRTADANTLKGHEVTSAASPTDNPPRA